MELDSLDTPTRIHTGVLYVQKKPIYIIEVVEEHGNPAEYVTIYDAHQPRTLSREDLVDITPVKAYDRVEKEIGKIKDTTILGQLASKINKPTKKIIHITKPPLFMTDIQVGVDTFTGKEGKGFYEREKDVVRITGKGMDIKHGDRTGVFISFDSIVWEKLKIPTDDVLMDYQARKTLFFM